MEPPAQLLAAQPEKRGVLRRAVGMLPVVDEQVLRLLAEERDLGLDRLAGDRRHRPIPQLYSGGPWPAWVGLEVTRRDARACLEQQDPQAALRQFLGSE